MTRQQQRMNEIVFSARKRFASQGYKKTSLEDIAGDVGVAKSAIYKYFPSKKHILDTVMNELVARHAQMCRHVILDYWGVRERISTLMLKTRELLIRSADGVGLHRESWKELKPLVTHSLQLMQAQFTAAITEIIDQGLRNREIVCEEPSLVARMLSLMITDMLHQTVTDSTPPDEAEQIRRLRTLVTVVLNGMAPRHHQGRDIAETGEGVV